MNDIDIKNRISEFCKEKGISIRRFEMQSNLSNGYVSSMRKGIGTEKLQNILSAFPDLNRDWLLFGEGTMTAPVDQRQKVSNLSYKEEKKFDNSLSSIKRQWLNSNIDNLLSKGFTKAEIARKLSILPQQLNNILHGKRSITDQFLDKFNEKFGLEFDYDALNKTVSDEKLSRFKKAVQFLLDNRRIYNDSDLANLLGKHKSYISEILSGKRELTQKFISEFTACFGNISPNWLLTGDGEMLFPSEENPSYGKDKLWSMIDMLREQLKTKDEQINSLLKIIQDLPKSQT